MEYPIFDVPLFGGSLLIAAIAIFHVFIAQFSVGAGWLLVLAERRANRENDLETLAFLKKYAKAVLLIPYVLGTVTGVGIWFTTAIVNPRAISTMIHLFVWGWAAEWTMFIVEVTAIYLYFYTWDRIRPAAHNAIGLIFAIASIITLVLINGILCFMLTPNSWQPLAEHGFWKAFFNPSFFPTTLERILVSLALAGAGAILLLAMLKNVLPHTRERVSQVAYRLMLPSLLCLPLSGWAFATLPQRAKDFLQGGSPVMLIFLAVGMTCFLLLAVAAIVAIARKETSPSVLGGCLLVLFAFVSYGSFEFVREGVRKPYIIEGFMYSTGVTVGPGSIDKRASLEYTQKHGVMASAPWAMPAGKTWPQMDEQERGRSIYMAACHSCHQAQKGYNALAPAIQGWPRPVLRAYLDTMHIQKPAMPPFPGTADEKDLLTVYLSSLSQRAAQ